YYSSLSFVLHSSLHHPDLHSFPTRRSSDLDESFTVFTTRPDTIFGATYAVLAPEHPLVKKIVSEEQQNDVQNYIEKIQAKSDLRSEEHTSELQSRFDLVCRLLLEKKKKTEI